MLAHRVHCVLPQRQELFPDVPVLGSYEAQLRHRHKHPRSTVTVELDEQLSVVDTLLQEAVRPIELIASTPPLVDVKLYEE